LYAVVNDHPLTLDHIVACDAYPSEVQLASILAQVGQSNWSQIMALLIVRRSLMV
jgi:hypothetical protein